MTAITSGNLLLPMEVEQIFDESKKTNEENTNANKNSNDTEMKIDSKSNKYNRCEIGLTIFRPRYMCHRHCKNLDEVKEVIKRAKQEFESLKPNDEADETDALAKAALPPREPDMDFSNAALYRRFGFMGKGYLDSAPQDEIIYHENASLIAMLMAIVKINSEQKYYRQHLYDKKKDFKIAQLGGVRTPNHQNDDFDMDDNNNNNNNNNKDKDHKDKDHKDKDRKDKDKDKDKGKGKRTGKGKGKGKASEKKASNNGTQDKYSLDYLLNELNLNFNLKLFATDGIERRYEGEYVYKITIDNSEHSEYWYKEAKQELMFSNKYYHENNKILSEYNEMLYLYEFKQCGLLPKSFNIVLNKMSKNLAIITSHEGETLESMVANGEMSHEESCERVNQVNRKFSIGYNYEYDDLASRNVIPKNENIDSNVVIDYETGPIAYNRSTKENVAIDLSVEFNQVKKKRVLVVNVYNGSHQYLTGIYVGWDQVEAQENSENNKNYPPRDNILRNINDTDGAYIVAKNGGFINRIQVSIPSHQLKIWNEKDIWSKQIEMKVVCDLTRCVKLNNCGLPVEKIEKYVTAQFWDD